VAFLFFCPIRSESGGKLLTPTSDCTRVIGILDTDFQSIYSVGFYDYISTMMDLRISGKANGRYHIAKMSSASADVHRLHPYLLSHPGRHLFTFPVPGNLSPLRCRPRAG